MENITKGKWEDVVAGLATGQNEFYAKVGGE
jgi:hypothetical protein